MSAHIIELLPRDELLHMLRYLPGRDLVSLSAVNKKYRDIVAQQPGLATKIRVALDFKGPLDLTEALAVIRSRGITAIRLGSTGASTSIVDVLSLESFLVEVSEFMNDVTVSGRTSIEIFASVLNIFLHEITAFGLKSVSFANDTVPSYICRGTNYPLKKLKILGTEHELVSHLFDGCTNLEDFHYQAPRDSLDNAFGGAFNDLLAKNVKLKNLLVNAYGLQWTRLSCFNLKYLRATCEASTVDELASSVFIGLLPGIRTIHLTLYNHPSRRLVQSLANKTSLKKLTIRCWSHGLENSPEESYEGIINQSLFHLNIHDDVGVVGQLLRVFLAVMVIHLEVTGSTLDLSNVPCTTIAQIRFYANEGQRFHLQFSPEQIPGNLGQFQKLIMNFVNQYWNFIPKITIGHPNWRRYGLTKLSNKFVERLLTTGDIAGLEIYNLSDRDALLVFCQVNEGKLALRELKVHEPNEPNGTPTEKLRFFFD